MADSTGATAGATRSKGIPANLTLKELLEQVTDGATGKPSAQTGATKRQNAKLHDGYYVRVVGTLNGVPVVLMLQAWAQ